MCDSRKRRSGETSSSVYDFETEENEDISAFTTYQEPSSRTYKKNRHWNMKQIEDGIKDGTFMEEPKCDTFNVVVDEWGIDVGCARCVKCRRIVSSKCGGHKTIHRKGECVAQEKSQKRRITLKDTKKLLDAFTAYVLKSGASFHHLESAAFRDFSKQMIEMGNPEFDIESLPFPCEETIRQSVETEGRKIQFKIGEMIRGPIERNEACFVLDFGKKLHNFLSIFVAYVDRNDAEPRVKVVPFLFTPVFISKTASNVYALILDAGEKIGLKEDEIKQVRLVGDGAANLKKLDEYFRSYSVCSCHSLQKSAERCIEPLKEHKEKKFTGEELKMLEKINEAIDTCGELAILLRRKKDMLGIKRLPTAYCKTRWLTFAYCVRDILAIQSEIECITDKTIANLWKKLKPHLSLLMSAMSVLKQYEQPLKLFEKTSSNLHEVAPKLFCLLESFKKEQERGKEENDFTLQTISKSAQISLQHYIETTVGQVHLFSTYLCPSMRSLKQFPDEYKAKITQLLSEELEKIQVETVNMDSIPNKNQADESGMYDDVPPFPTAAEEYEDYDKMRLTITDRNLTTLQFWTKHSDRFPRLSKIATSISCVLASETCCERAFSALNNVFRAERQRLDPEMVETLMISFLYLNGYT